ncbi:glyoxalase [Pseudoalteromonas rubra]|uniref:Glyoxalase n=1 Tax=Pseudoalteromonas rubra TaxID=43658 RepID=A0A5S3WHY8_9GAMM|nr:VOC family protein [Pseudoalteromonas rubra]TMP26837.1 glyoxalase [Pseudoalteromonas rubra]TMP33778.1 glyoxalase [Pseudoalteromonas rubra]
MTHHALNYVEFAASDLTATQAFFESVFGWQFQSYGPEYVAFSESGLEGGFFQSELSASQDQGAPLLVLYSQDLEQTQQAVEQAGATINKAIFSFPGGRRFHFIEPSGNELAVWSDK